MLPMLAISVTPMLVISLSSWDQGRAGEGAGSSQSVELETKAMRGFAKISQLRRRPLLELETKLWVNAFA